MNPAVGHLPQRIRIGTPSGVGDVYWVLGKLRSLREQHKIKHVTLCVQKSHAPRAMDWSKMVDFVDATEEFTFTKNKEIDQRGWTRQIRGVDIVLWPNAMIDKGFHLSKWLPGYDLDMEFPIATAPVKDPGIVVYASSEGVNKAWFPMRGPVFWSRVLKHVHHLTGRPATLIGAGWDQDFANRIPDAPCIDLIGKTPLPEVTGIIRNATCVIGIISGMTILANHFRTPCVAIYPDKFLPGFLTSWLKMNVPYQPIKASQVGTPEALVGSALKLLPSLV